MPAKEMFGIVENYVFPFLQECTAASTHGKHMKGARFTIPTPALLQKAVDGLDAIARWCVRTDRVTLVTQDGGSLELILRR